MFVPVPVPFPCQVRLSGDRSGQWQEARVFAFRPVVGQQIGFRVHLQCGALYYPVYAHEIRSISADRLPETTPYAAGDPDLLHPWNALASTATAYRDPYLAQMGGKIMARDVKPEHSVIDEYLFTICFEDGPFVADSEQFKAFEVVFNSCGHLHVRPGYNYLWLDRSFTEHELGTQRVLPINTGWVRTDEAHK